MITSLVLRPSNAYALSHTSFLTRVLLPGAICGLITCRILLIFNLAPTRQRLSSRNPKNRRAFSDLLCLGSWTAYCDYNRQLPNPCPDDRRRSKVPARKWG